MTVQGAKSQAKNLGYKPAIIILPGIRIGGKKLNKKVSENGSMQTNLVPDIRYPGICDLSLKINIMIIPGLNQTF